VLNNLWKLTLHVYVYRPWLHTMAAVVSRTLLDHRRRPSPLAIASTHGKQTIGDSSDDEDLAPIKLSAEAEEILGEDAALIRSARKQLTSFYGNDAVRRSERKDSEPQVLQRRRLGSVSPGQSNGSPVPRVVRVNSGPRPTMPGTLGRDGSFLYKNHARTTELESQIPHDSITPAPRLVEAEVRLALRCPTHLRTNQVALGSYKKKSMPNKRKIALMVWIKERMETTTNQRQSAPLRARALDEVTTMVYRVQCGSRESGLALF
jgi:hypothetical protein